MPIGALVLFHALLLPAPAGSPAVRENVVVTAERAPEPRESVPAAVSVHYRKLVAMARREAALSTSHSIEEAEARQATKRTFRRHSRGRDALE